MPKKERRTAPQPYTLPVFPESLARFIYSEFTEDHRSSLLTTATHMDVSNPGLLDHLLLHSFGYLAADKDPRVGLCEFVGASVVYRFFDQDADDRAINIIQIPKDVIEKWDKEEHRLRNNFQHAKSQAAKERAYAEYRQRGLKIFQRIKEHNKFLGLATNTLGQNMIEAGLTADESAVFFHGIAMTHDLFDLASSKPATTRTLTTPETQQVAPNQPPIISATTARLGLVQILLDPVKFAADSMREMKGASPVLEQHVLKMADKDLPTYHLQILLASYTFHCFDREFKRLGRRFPTIYEDAISAGPINPHEFTRRVLEPSFDELRLGNPEFHARVMTELLQSYVKPKEGKKFAAVMGGVQTVYLPLRQQLATNLRNVN